MIPPKIPVTIGAVVGGRYRVDRLIGAGGMGTVVQATHLELAERVAIKFLSAETADRADGASRLLREARAMFRLKSDHVGKVLDVGRLDSGTPYMVLEYLEGKDLGGVVRERGPLPVEEAVNYVLQACEALAEAHAAGVIHRDIKPQNLFLTRRLDGTPLVKVLDFGLSKVSDRPLPGEHTLTMTAAVMGSPPYMSPEQCKATHEVDARSDIWSMGVVLYQLLAGKLPYDAENIVQLRLRILGAQIKPLRNVRTGLPDGLEAVIMRCLRVNPAERYQTISALAEALTVFAPGATTPPLQIGPLPLASDLDVTKPRARGATSRRLNDSGEMPTQAEGARRRSSSALDPASSPSRPPSFASSPGLPRPGPSVRELSSSAILEMSDDSGAGMRAFAPPAFVRPPPPAAPPAPPTVRDVEDDEGSDLDQTYTPPPAPPPKGGVSSGTERMPIALNGGQPVMGRLPPRAVGPDGTEEMLTPFADHDGSASAEYDGVPGFAPYSPAPMAPAPAMPPPTAAPILQVRSPTLAERVRPGALIPYGIIAVSLAVAIGVVGSRIGKGAEPVPAAATPVVESATAQVMSTVFTPPPPASTAAIGPIIPEEAPAASSAGSATAPASSASASPSATPHPASTGATAAHTARAPAASAPVTPPTAPKAPVVRPPPAARTSKPPSAGTPPADAFGARW